MDKAWTREDLSRVDTFFIETTKNEHFKIEKNGGGYMLTDITPPILELDIANYASVKISKNVQEKIKQNPTYDFLSVKGVKFFDGIAKGGMFAFYPQETPECMTVTKGTVEKLYIKQPIKADKELNIHLIEAPGKKIEQDKFSKENFIVYTTTDEYHFNLLNGSHYFENRKVLGIFSFLYPVKQNEIFQMDVFDVTSTFFYINRPFIVLTEKEGKKNASYIFTPIQSVEKKSSL